MIRGNKKGDAAVNWGLGLLIAAIGVGIIVYFLWGVGEKGEGLSDLAPDQIALIATACQNTLFLSNPADFCADPKMAKSKVYVTCNYGPMAKAMDGDKIEATYKVCNSAQHLDLFRQNCKDLKPSATNVITINGVSGINSEAACDALAYPASVTLTKASTAGTTTGLAVCVVDGAGKITSGKPCQCGTAICQLSHMTCSATANICA